MNKKSKKINLKNAKGQSSIEFMILLAAIVVGLVVAGVFIFKLENVGFTEIKTENLNIISSMEYLTPNSILLSITENIPITSFNLTIKGSPVVYSYNVISKGINNYGQFVLIANSSIPYNSFNINNICAINFLLNKTIYSFVKNCTA